MTAVVDNTFASPYLCNPARHGFSYVLHSATKYVGGHHDLIGGVVCTSEAGRAGLRDTALDTGGTMSPFEAWLCMRGAMTLALRMDRHSANALSIAAFLEGHAKVERVWYPGLASHPHHAVAVRQFGDRGFGGMLAVEVAGGVGGGQRFCDALELAWVATSLGGTHTLVGHAASTTHRQMDAATRAGPQASPMGSSAFPRVSRMSTTSWRTSRRRWRRCERSRAQATRGRAVRRPLGRARDLVHLGALGDRRARSRARTRSCRSGSPRRAAGTCWPGPPALARGVRPAAGGDRATPAATVELATEGAASELVTADGIARGDRRGLPGAARADGRGRRASRACSSSPACPTWARACSAPRSAWTRP